VIEHSGFFLRQGNNLPRPVGKPLEHAPRSPSHRHLGLCPLLNTISRICKDRRLRTPRGYRPGPRLYRLSRQAGDPAISRQR
jgi:hypothetical protein